MTVKELFNSVSLEELEKACDNETYGIGKKYKKVMLYAYNNIKNIIPVKDIEKEVSHILVSLSMDDCADDEDLKNQDDLFYLSMTGFNPDKPFTNYGMEFTAWEKILAYEVWDNSIKAFGKANCLVAIIYEMTFFGCDQESHVENTENEMKILNERAEDAKEHPEKLISADEFFASIGYVDTRTEEDIKREHAISDDIMKINIIHTIGLLGYDYFSNGEKYNTYMNKNDVLKVKELVLDNVKGYDLLNKCKELFPDNTFFSNRIFWKE